jgi:hypothetical protein
MKIEKEKGKREKGPRGPIRPGQKNDPTAHPRRVLNRYDLLCLSSPTRWAHASDPPFSLIAGPHMSSPTSGQDSSPRTGSTPSVRSRLLLRNPSPDTPPSFPFAPSRRHRVITARSLAELRGTCERLRWNSTPTVIPAPSCSSYPLCFALSHLLDQHPSSNPSQINAIAHLAKHLPPCATPAAPPSIAWTQSRFSTKLSTSPRRAEPRHVLALVQRSPEPRRSTRTARPRRRFHAETLAR